VLPAHRRWCAVDGRLRIGQRRARRGRRRSSLSLRLEHRWQPGTWLEHRSAARPAREEPERAATQAASSQPGHAQPATHYCAATLPAVARSTTGLTAVVAPPSPAAHIALPSPRREAWRSGLPAPGPLSPHPVIGAPAGGVRRCRRRWRWCARRRRDSSWVRVRDARCLSGQRRPLLERLAQSPHPTRTRTHETNTHTRDAHCLSGQRRPLLERLAQSPPPHEHAHTRRTHTHETLIA